jgi:hypothetical protein
VVRGGTFNTVPRPKKDVTWLSASLWFFGGIGLLVAMGMGVQYRADQQQAEWDAASGSAIVELAGVMSGDSYSLGHLGTAHTSAEHTETTLEVNAARIETRYNSRTPTVIVHFSEVDLTCGTPRNWMWSTEEGSTLTLLCDRYVLLDDLRNLGTGTVESA